MSDSSVNVVNSGLTSVDHISLLEFHGFSSLLLKFSRNDNSATSGTLIDNLSNDRVSSHSYRYLRQKFNFTSFSLSGGTKSFILNFDDVEFNGVFWVTESLLDQ